MLSRKQEVKIAASDIMRWCSMRPSSEERHDKRPDMDRQMSRDDFIKRFPLAKQYFRKSLIRGGGHPNDSREKEAIALKEYRYVGGM